ncbi:ABC transporter substrate-binding protein [Burkholderia diffusa]|uniref:ABC transporter substrate-binding protein n=1 Tax=Burkholderia diffusa TaxID=488732 RepID=UPI002ABDD9CE|nr:PhnD/SsuA/transferrin family substrate-binding protein [Burkholderia diffusa]
MSLKLTFACGEYDRTIPFRTGTIRPRDIELDYTPQAPELTFYEQMKDLRWDICEMSMSAYVQMRAKGRDDLIALPVFPSRVFRHSALYVRTDSDIRHPEELRGKRVGIGWYQMSGAVWCRGALLDDYGIKPSEITWVSGTDVEAAPDADQVHQAADMVAGTKQDKPRLEVMLERGDIDALLSVHSPRAMARNEGTVRYLFENCREVEEDYFRRTGIFPMMHTLVMKRAIYDQHPWAAQSLFDAFEEAKDRAVANLYELNALAVAAPFIVHEVERTRQLMGMDYWPFGVSANRHSISTFVRHLHDQNIISTKPDVLDLFVNIESRKLHPTESGEEK